MKGNKRGFDMRHLLLIVCCIVCTSVHAETFKCVSPSGAVFVSDLPCEQGKKFIDIRRSESVQNSEAARREVERQKAIADTEAAENEAARRSTSGATSLPDESSAPLASPELSFPGGSTSGSGAPGATPTVMPPTPTGTPPTPTGTPPTPTGMLPIRRN